MNFEPKEEWYLNQAKNYIEENKLDDAVMILRGGQYVLYSCDRITSLLSSVLERQASFKETPMADDTRNYRNNNPETSEKQETMLDKEKKMMRNVFIMRSKILSMQVKVAVDKINSLESLEPGILDATNETEQYRERAEKYFSQNNYEEADTYIFEAEQLYSKMAAKLFPAKPKKEEKLSEEYLRMKRNKTSSNHAGVTVRGNKEDVVACIDKATKAFAANELEKARNWLNKSLRILYTANALELLDKVQAAIAARDAPKEIPSVNSSAGPDNNDTNSVVDPNPERAQTRTTTESPSGPTVHNENVEGAKTCIAKASKALIAGDFDKAENLLLKAKRMDSSLDVEQCLKRVLDARARNTTSLENAVPEKGLRETERLKQADIEEANTYLQIAGNAFNDKKYERALIFLDKSEAMHTSERSVTLRKKVQDAMSKPKKSLVENCASYFTKEKPSKPSDKEKLDELITAIRNDIDAGNLKEAERKLQTPGFAKAVQLKKLRTEVEEKIAQRTREDKPKTEQSNTKLMEQVEPPRNEMLSDMRAKDAYTCIDIAEKAYYDGDLDRAERLLRKAERLFPTERAKKALETVCTAIEEKQRLDNEKPKHNENESATPPVEYASETIVRDDVQKLINSGVDALEKQDYFSAEWSFKRAKQLQPSISKYVDEVLTDIETKTKKRNAITGTNTISTPKSIEGISTGTQNRQIEKPKNNSDPIASAYEYTEWAQDAYNHGDIEHAESFLKLAEVYNSTERSRKLLVMILRAKHGVDPSESDDDDVNTFVVVNHSRRKKSYEKVIKENGCLISAQDAFISGNFKEANNLMNKLEVHQSPYVTELKEKIKKSLARDSHWYDKINIFK